MGTTGVTFSGIASGLPVDKLIEATINANSVRLNSYKKNKDTCSEQQTAYKAIKSKYSLLDSSLQTVVDSKLVYAFDLFDKKTSKVSDEGVGSVSLGKGAMAGNYSMKVNSLATPPSVTVSDFAGPITSKVSLYQLGVIEGSFGLSFQTPDGTTTVAVDVTADDTIDSYMAKLNQAIKDNEKIDGSISYNVDALGVLNLDFSGVTGGTLTTGQPFSKTESNLADVFGLTQNGNVLTGVPKSSLNLDAKLSDSGIKSLGTLTYPSKINIGGLEVEIKEDTTLRNIMNTVNENAKCQVTMKYSNSENALIFTAKDNFYSDYIYFGGKGFLSDIGLTDSNGAVDVSKQVKRQQGEIEIDGKVIAIKSNKVTPAETGFEGISVNIFSTTNDEDGPLKITVSDNTDALTSSIKSVVDAFNGIVDTVKKYTYVTIDDTKSSDDSSSTYESGCLSSDYTVTSMQTTLQMIFMSPVNQNLDYKALAVIGFSTEDGKLKFDQAKFLNAVKDNSSDVKKLLVGDKEKTMKGIFEKVQDQLDIYTNLESGFFVTKDSSLTRTMKDLNKSITDEQSRLDQERARLVQQYSNLDALISKYQSQGSAFSS